MPTEVLATIGDLPKKRAYGIFGLQAAKNKVWIAQAVAIQEDIGAVVGVFGVLHQLQVVLKIVLVLGLLIAEFRQREILGVPGIGGFHSHFLSLVHILGQTAQLGFNAWGQLDEVQAPAAMMLKQLAPAPNVP